MMDDDRWLRDAIARARFADFQREVREMRRGQAQNLLDRITAAADEVGCQRPVTVRVDGMLTGALEREVRTQLSKAWNCSSLRIEIESPGGSTAAAMNVASDVADIAAMGRPVTSAAGRIVASAALEIYLAAPWRVARPDSKFLMHGVSFRLDRPALANGRALRALADKADDFNKNWIAVLKKKLVLTDRMVAILKNYDDLGFGSDMALAINLCHQLEEPRPARMLR